MTHDPLCPATVMPWEDSYCCQTCNPGETPPWERTCQCLLIAEVTDAVLDKARESVEALHSAANSPATEGAANYKAGVDDALQAIDATLIAAHRSRLPDTTDQLAPGPSAAVGVDLTIEHFAEPRVPARGAKTRPRRP